MAFYSPGDVEITAASLSGQNGVVDITDLMQLVQVYESILTPGVNAEVIVLDDKNLMQVLPLVGQEVLHLTFATPSLAAADYTFSVAKMSDANPTSSLKAKAYKLTCVAPEVLAHKSTLVSKSYNTNYHMAIQDIFTGFLGSKKPLLLEATQGIQQFIVSNKKPFVAIMDMLKRSASETSPSSAFVFFENQAGYRLATIESLFSTGSKMAYTNDAVTADSIFRVIFKNVLGYNLPEVYDVPNAMGEGLVSSIMKTFDFKSLSFNTSQVTPSSIMKLGGAVSTIAAGFAKQYASAGSSAFVPQDSSKPETHISNFLPNRKAYVAALDHNKLTIRGFGDSTLMAGDVVSVSIQTTDSSTGLSSPDPLLSGEWLVAHLKHVIGPADVKPRFTNVLELVKGGYNQAA